MKRILTVNIAKDQSTMFGSPVATPRCKCGHVAQQHGTYVQGQVTSQRCRYGGCQCQLYEAVKATGD